MKLNRLVLIGMTLIAFACANVLVGQDTNEQDEPKAEAKDLRSRMQAVFEQLDSGEYDAALKDFREIAKEYPDNLQVRLTLVNVYQSLGMESVQKGEREGANDFFLEGAKEAREVAKMKGLPSGADSLIGSSIYNEACTLALLGRKDEALASLKESFESGFSDFDLALEDSDFGDLLKSDDFKKIVEEGRKAAMERMIAAVKEEIADFESFDFKLATKGTAGEEISLDSLKGKVVIVDFWGTWCPPCRAEIPSFIKLKKEYGDKLEVIGLAYENGDEEENLEAVNDYIKENDLNYPCALGDEETMDQVENFEGFPTTLFIDRSGKVRMLTVGLEPYARLEALTAELINEK